MPQAAERRQPSMPVRPRRRRDGCASAGSARIGWRPAIVPLRSASVRASWSAGRFRVRCTLVTAPDRYRPPTPGSESAGSPLMGSTALRPRERAAPGATLSRCPSASPQRPARCRRRRRCPDACSMHCAADGGITSAKDGCAPQGQCGCCTVLVDGRARVACVTPLRRVSGRAVETVEGLDPAVAPPGPRHFVVHGASQCGFCTPGIVMRLEDRRRRLIAESVEGDRRSRTGARRVGGGAARPRRSPLSLHRVAGRSTGGGGRAVGLVRRARLPVPAPTMTPQESTEAALPLRGLRSRVLGPQRVDRGRGAGRRQDSQPTPRRRTPWWPWSARTVSGSSARRSARPVNWRARCRDGARTLEGRAADSVARRASGPRRCEPRGWSRRTWRPMPRGASPGGEPATPLANGGAFGAKRESPLPGVGPSAGRRARAARYWPCGRGRT